MFTDYGRQKTMDQLILFLNSSTTGPAVHLFTNNRTPTPFDKLAEYTELVAASMPGYSSTTMQAGWVDGRDAPSQSWTAYQPTQFRVTCTATAVGLPQTVYGYYLDVTNQTLLLDAVALPTPFTFTNVNDTLEIAVTIPLISNAIG